MQDMQYTQDARFAEGTDQDASLNSTSANGQNGHSDVSVGAPLSNRETQIVQMIAMGKKVSNIAVELGLSVKTVSTYRVRALHKLGALTNADLTRYASHLPPAQNGAQSHADTPASMPQDNLEPQQNMNGQNDEANHEEEQDKELAEMPL